tara:strand:+ start:392 stop:1063 length:672 start_codon:yes stop_codon:yes gene_type:complete
MPTITATNDGNINKNLGAGDGGSWDAVHDATSGTVASSQTSTTTGVARIVVFTFSGATRWIIHRSFYEFDTSGITIAPSEATLKIFGVGNTTTDVIAVKGTQSDSLTSADYDNIDVSVPYSAEVASWSASGYNDFTLNAAALQDMVDNDSLKVAVISHDYDYLDVDPGDPSVSFNLGGYYSEADAENRPHIDYTAGVIDAVIFTEIKSIGGNIDIKGGNLTIK